MELKLKREELAKAHREKLRQKRENKVLEEAKEIPKENVNQNVARLDSKPCAGPFYPYKGNGFHISKE